jgi:LysR family transcriptional regulator, glycine cleavage system transcriptional activator
MSYYLPPLNGLRAFEAAARHLSFKHAANELCVTPGAVSQQVKALEEALGFALFRRLPRSLVLTPAGEAYLSPISAAFRLISDATETAGPSLSGRRFRLGVAHRLLGGAYPAIARLRQRKGAKGAADLTACDDFAELIEGRLDALLRPAGGNFPGFHSETIDLQTAIGTFENTVLVTVPGLAGCGQHRALVKLLKEKR